MRRMFIPAILLLVALATATSAAERTPLAERAPFMYVAIDGGVSLVSDADVDFFGVPGALESKVGGSITGEIGSQASEHLRFALSLQYDRFEASSVRIQGRPESDGQIVNMMRPLWNLYFDLGLLDGLLRPYVGGGVGAAWATFDSGSLGYGTTSDWGLAYAIHAGTHIALSDAWLLKAGYRFSGTGSLWNSQDNFIFGNVRSHDFIVGVRRDF